MARGANAQGKNALCAVSRQILQASRATNYASAAEKAARQLARETWSVHAAG
jgi:hypothetical protein